MAPYDKDNVVVFSSRVSATYRDRSMYEVGLSLFCCIAMQRNYSTILLK